jgi:frataxin-like iron-binding protein CyaY
MITTDTSKRSSNISKISYDAANQALEVEFKSGGRYRYHRVSPSDHQRFLDAPSLGKHFNQEYWGSKKHPSQKLEPTAREKSGPPTDTPV